VTEPGILGFAIGSSKDATMGTLWTVRGTAIFVGPPPCRVDDRLTARADERPRSAIEAQAGTRGPAGCRRYRAASPRVRVSPVERCADVGGRVCPWR
jgi:hypothetical protein